MSRKSNGADRYVRIGRVRTIKPQFFTHEALFDAEKESGLPLRLAFAGLWTQCDRKGRFLWRPRMLKLAILPYDADVDFARVLDALRTRGFLVRYELATEVYGWIPSFLRHQVINNREQESVIPPPTDEGIKAADMQIDLIDLAGASPTRVPRVADASATPLVQDQGEGKGREGNIDTAKAVSCPEQNSGPAPVEKLPLNNGSEYSVSQIQVKEWARLYPAVDIHQELRNMRGWLIANERNRKTSGGILKFIIGWLKKEQDRAPRVPVASSERRDAPAPIIDHDPLPAGLDERDGQHSWAQVQPILAKAINQHSYDTWIKPLRAAGRKDHKLFLLVPTPEFKHAVEKYRPALLDALLREHVTELTLVY